MVLTGLVQLVKNAKIFHQLFLRLVDYAQENEALISPKLFPLFLKKNRPGKKLSSYGGPRGQNFLNETLVVFSPLHLVKSTFYHSLHFQCNKHKVLGQFVHC